VIRSPLSSLLLHLFYPLISFSYHQLGPWCCDLPDLCTSHSAYVSHHFNSLSRGHRPLIDHYRETVAIPKQLPSTPICFITLASSIVFSWCASLFNYISRYLVRHWIALLCHCIAALTILSAWGKTFKTFDIQPQRTTFSVSLLQLSLSLFLSLSKSSSSLSPFRRCHSIKDSVAGFLVLCLLSRAHACATVIRLQQEKSRVLPNSEFLGPYLGPRLLFAHHFVAKAENIPHFLLWIPS
jgi:hypothetical protein